MTEEKTSLSKEEQDMIKEIIKESCNEATKQFHDSHNKIKIGEEFSYMVGKVSRLIAQKALQKGKEMAFLEKTQEKTDEIEQCRRCGSQCKKSEIRISSCDDHFPRIGKRTICYKAECRICPDCFYGYDKSQASKIAELEEKLKKENEMNMKLAKENGYFHKWVDEKTLRISELEKENKQARASEREKVAKEILELICPEHNRTSCSDTDTQNGLYSNDSYTRCARCTLLEIIKLNKIPKSHSCNISFYIDDKIADKEDKQKYLGKKVFE